MSDFYEGSNTVRHTYGTLDIDDRGTIDGAVHTPHGTVTITGVELGRDQFIRIETVRDGRLYYRWEHRRGHKILSNRGLKTHARRWAQDLATRLERSESDGE